MQKSVLLRQDWDFSSCSKEELYLFWSYEYRREIDWLKKEYIIRMKLNPFDPDEDEWWYPLYLDDSEPDVVTSQAWLPPGFPQSPFLCLPSALRKAPPPLKTSDDFWARFPDLEDRPVFLAQTEAARKGDFCYPICINWSKSDKAIRKKFAQLLKTLRLESRRHASETQGKSPARRLRSELKALGAYRILGELTASQAITYTAAEGSLLFADEVDWSKAKTKAKRIICDTFQISKKVRYPKVRRN